MNEHELRRRRWDRLGRALNDAAGAAGREVEELIHEIVARMEEDEVSGAEGNAMPDPELVDRLIAAAARKKTIIDLIMPVVDRQGKQATSYSPADGIPRRLMAGTWK